MISKSLSTSEKRAALHQVCPKLAEFCQALYPLIVAHADEQGRLAGDEFTVKHLVDPASPRKLADFTAALLSLHQVGLILWYQVSGKKLIEVVSFTDHQDLKGHQLRPGKHKPCPDDSAFIGQKTQVGEVGECLPKPALREEKLREEKGREEKTVAGVEKAPTPTRDFLGWFVDEYRSRRSGAKYLITDKHGGIVKRLLQHHPPERLRQLALVLFGSNDDWIESTDRGIEVLAAKINWLEERLSEWEKKKKAREAV